MNRSFFRTAFAAFLAASFFFLAVNTTSCSDEKFGGIGLRVAQLYDPDVPNKKGALVVLKVMNGLSADQAGVLEGDMITHIDGQSVKSQSFDDLITNHMRGPAGSEITITLERFGELKAETVNKIMKRRAMKDR